MTIFADENQQITPDDNSTIEQIKRITGVLGQVQSSHQELSEQPPDRTWSLNASMQGSKTGVADLPACGPTW